jgi:hypothetical protein
VEGLTAAGGNIGAARSFETSALAWVNHAYPLMRGKKPSVFIAVDPGNCRPVVIGWVVESNPQAVKHWLEPLVKSMGVSVIISDD